jgi:putative nucleotidyltransferase with HDIG domain
VGLALAVGTWSLLPAGLFFVPAVEPGTIAGRDFVAPEELLVPDEEAAQEKQRRAREDVLPVYDYDPAVWTEVDGALAALFAAGRRELGEAPMRVREGAGWPAEATRRLAEASGLKLSAQQVVLLADREFSADLEDRLRGVASQVLRRGVVANKSLLLENRLRGITRRDLGGGGERTDVDLFDHLGYPDEVQELLESEVRNWAGLTARERRAMVDLLLGNLPANLHLNRSETVARREAAAAATEPVFTQIRKGQVIVRQGDQVNPAQARAISRIAGDRPFDRRLLPALGTFFFLALAAAVLWVALRGERVADHSRRRLYGEAMLLLLVSLLGTKLFVLVATAVGLSFDAPPFNSVQSYVYCVPFAALALVAGLLFGRQPALMLALMFSLLVSRLAPGEPLAAVVYSIAGSLAAVYGLEKYQFKQRLVMARIGLLVGVVNVAAILILVALAGGADRGPTLVAFDLACGFTGGLLVAAAVSFALPIFEALFGITTDIKLVELANTNLPLLRRLAFEAPGTFQHSLMVANLAKVGCEAVEADATLAYTGGLYHDVGKILRPEYFAENQRPGQNRHDKLLPSMSALVLISHIKDGVELAREHHLPQPIIDAIEQHHGTRLMRFFYDRAVQQCDPATDEVAEGKYRYPGPKPRSKVMGVLMLADGVEAASRTLIDPTEVKVRALIRTLVESALADGQLDHTDLTLGDLNKVSEAFLRVLTNIFHRRVDYPGFDFNAGPRREPRPATGAVRAS